MTQQLIAPAPDQTTPPPFHGQAMSPEEFAALPANGYRYEYIKGEARAMSPAGGRHGGIAVRLIVLFGNTFAGESVAHHIFDSSTGYRLPNRDVLFPDVSVIRSGRLPDEEEPVGYIELPPDLAVEIVSPSDLYETVQEKVHVYLNWGVTAVWVLEPALRQVMVHTAQDVTRIGEGGTLTGGATVPSFQCTLDQIFPPVTRS